MTNDRQRALIERLLSEAEDAVVAGQWDVVARHAQSVLALEPTHSDALAFKTLAERLASHSPKQQPPSAEHQVCADGLVAEEDSCVLCLRGCDSVIAYIGTTEFIMAGLCRLGIEMDEVLLMVSAVTGLPSGRVLPGEHTHYVRICEACAARVGAPRPGLFLEGETVPGYRESSMFPGRFQG